LGQEREAKPESVVAPQEYAGNSQGAEEARRDRGDKGVGPDGSGDAQSAERQYAEPDKRTEYLEGCNEPPQEWSQVGIGAA